MKIRLTVFALVVASAVDAQSRLPSRMSDAEFWFLSHTLSEENGFFQSENYVSNELEMQRVIPRFASISSDARNVYVGVGPEQNYTYIAALRPQVAFIVDIRRGNLLEHLMYKALFELSEDRVDFLSRLLSRPRPANLRLTVGVDSIASLFWRAAPDTALFRRNKAAIYDMLLNRHAFPLTSADTTQLGVIYQMFFRGGLDITYSFPRANTRRDATLYDLVVAVDSTGVQRGFLASDSAFRFVKDMHTRNMIVPVVGDFAGPKALREIGKWLRERQATVGAFYVSNVEQYLFQSGRWRAFYENVEALPSDSTSIFVRSITNPTFTYTVRVQSTPPACDSTRTGNGVLACVIGPLYHAYRDTRPGFRSMTSSLHRTLMAVPAGQLAEYFDLARISR